MAQNHLHLISDSTGGTAHSVAQACMSQFENVDVEYHNWTLIKTSTQLESVLDVVKELPGPVFYTLIDESLRTLLEYQCRTIGVPAVALLDRPIALLSTFFGTDAAGTPGRQHELNSEYFSRIAAMDFALYCDDGQSEFSYQDADVILVGPSRTSKTPTCVILAQKGIKAANIPLVPGADYPAFLKDYAKPLVVGLVTDPKKLMDIRRSRLEHLGQGQGTNYTDLDTIKQEIRDARRFFAANGWPTIDVSRRSIEETAAQIVNLLNKRNIETLVRAES